MFDSNVNVFENYKKDFKSFAFNNDQITQEDMRSEQTKKKLKQITEHRKKMMKDLYKKMFSSTPNIQSGLNINTNIKNSNDDMEIENENIYINIAFIKNWWIFVHPRIFPLKYFH